MTPQEIESLKAERNALAAHNSELVSACKLAIDMFVANDCNVPNTIETLQDAIDATPQQCLRDLKAEVILNFVMFIPRFAYSVNNEIEKFANQYAATVRQGGAE